MQSRGYRSDLLMVRLLGGLYRRQLMVGFVQERPVDARLLRV